MLELSRCCVHCRVHSAVPPAQHSGAQGLQHGAPEPCCPTSCLALQSPLVSRQPCAAGCRGAAWPGLGSACSKDEARRGSAAPLQLSLKKRLSCFIKKQKACLPTSIPLLPSWLGELFVPPGAFCLLHPCPGMAVLLSSPSRMQCSSGSCWWVRGQHSSRDGNRSSEGDSHSPARLLLVMRKGNAKS